MGMVRFHQLAFRHVTIALFLSARCLLSTSFSISRKYSRTVCITCPYRIVDISSVDEVASRWNKRVFNKRDSKESRLRAEPNARRVIQRM